MNHKVAVFVAKQVFESDYRGSLSHVKVPVVIIQSKKRYCSSKKFKKTILAMNHKVAVFVAKQVFESDYRGSLSHVKVPVVIIQSKKDIVAQKIQEDYFSYEP